MNRGEVIVIDPQAPGPGAVALAARIIDEGGLVVAPTETRYGLLTRADQPQAMARLYRLKKRDQAAPMALFFKDIKAVSEQAMINSAAQILADKFLPGPMTLVLPAREEAESAAVIDGKLGVRISSAPLMKALIERVEAPISATSANLSGHRDHVDLAGVRADFEQGVDLYLDGGPLEGALSTVVDCTADDCTILRQGAISVGEIDQALRGVN